MLNIKPQVLQALENNPALVSLLGVDKSNQKPIYQIVASDPDKFPRITFFELNNTDIDYADDEAFSSEIRIQIDVWSKGNTSVVAQEVDKSMKGIDFQRNYSIDLYESDTKIYHKVMRFVTTKLI